MSQTLLLESLYGISRAEVVPRGGRAMSLLSIIVRNYTHQKNSGRPLRVFQSFRYLGFDIASDGSWDKFPTRITQKAHGILARYRDFFRNQMISFKIRLQAARALIFSRIRYGQEIIGLNGTQRRQLDQILSSTLRVIFTDSRPIHVYVRFFSLFFLSLV